MGYTKVDLLHLLEDLRDAYADSLEETVLTELVANALDSGAHTVRITTDTAERLCVVVDDGSGMQRRDLRRFHDIAAYYRREVVEPGTQLIGAVLSRGIAAGEFRRVDVEAAVYSLVLPMVMLCVHKHSIGACQPFAAGLDPHDFVHRHVDLLLVALAAPQTKKVPAASTRKKKA